MSWNWLYVAMLISYLKHLKWNDFTPQPIFIWKLIQHSNLTRILIQNTEVDLLLSAKNSLRQWFQGIRLQIEINMVAVLCPIECSHSHWEVGIWSFTLHFMHYTVMFTMFSFSFLDSVLFTKKKLDKIFTTAARYVTSVFWNGAIFPCRYHRIEQMNEFTIIMSSDNRKIVALPLDTPKFICDSFNFVWHWSSSEFLIIHSNEKMIVDISNLKSEEL